jgi:hypothetical protein
VHELEVAVDYPMPPLLKRIYLGLADGGFGRRCNGLPFIDTTYRFGDSGPLLEKYMLSSSASERGGYYPRSIVPLLAGGCAI